MENDKRTEFFKVYSNLQLDLRKEIIVIVNMDDIDKPITWDVAFSEISNNTKMGEKILGKISKMGLI